MMVLESGVNREYRRRLPQVAVNVVLEDWALRPTDLTTADHVYGVMCASGLLMSTVWTECPMVAVGLWYGQA
jgi:hypothetical protein